MVPYNIEIQGIGKYSTYFKYKTSTNIKSQVAGVVLPLIFCIKSNKSYKPEPETDASSWKILSKIVLAANQFDKSMKID